MYQDLPFTGIGAGILTVAALLLTAGAALLKWVRA